MSFEHHRPHPLKLKAPGIGRRELLHLTYFLGFFFYVHSYLPLYVNSSFLSTKVSEGTVGLLYILASIIAIFVFVLTPRILEKIGNLNLTITSLVIEGLAMIGMAFIPSLPVILLSFVAHSVFVRVLAYNADIFLESASEDEETGGIRGLFLTITNVALIASPLGVGILLGQTNNYSRVYIAALVFLLPAFIFLITKLKSYEDPQYDRISFGETIKEIWRRKNLFKILASNLMLRLFYAWMVIYTPIYLHNHIGFAWEEIGVIFTIMLLPFVLFELPLGKIADTRLGEKEILTAGYVLLALSTAALSFVIEPSFGLWAMLLFVTRIGASAVEIMNETYFFKQIDDEDSHIVGFFRMIQPVAYILAPLLASLTLLIVDLRWSFLILGIIILWGLRYSLTLKDTR